MRSRTESLQLAKHSLFDLVVIGGGIAGAGVAQNAASRGLSVLLVEKDDFASGTSSRTTKLIHGGLRYLEQYRLKLTRQLSQERARLERLAPHLVRDFSFILPLSRRHRLFNWKAHLGLALYDLVAFSPQHTHHFQRLNTDAVLEDAPSLSVRDLSGGLKFHDAITDDSRIVLEVIKSACQEGAVALNYMQAKGFVAHGGVMEGVVCRDRYTGEEFLARAKAVVNATGVWGDEVCRLAEPGWRNKITPSKGIHIIVPSSAFEANSALFLPTSDNRYVFVVPWQRALMIGTTDTLYSGDINNPVPNGDEIDYLLHVVNSYTDTHKLNRSDITGTFAGLRPLVRFDVASNASGNGANGNGASGNDASRNASGSGTSGNGTSGNDASAGPRESSVADDTSSMSRDHLVFESGPGLINVAGGKLTSYRLMAEDVVQAAVRKLTDVSIKPSRTDTRMLGGWSHKNEYLAQVANISSKARRLNLDPSIIDHLIATYGADAVIIVDMVEQHQPLAERICPDYAPVMAEVIFCVQYEMALCLEDIFFRRTRLGILNARQTLEAAPKVANIMAQLLNWDHNRMAAELGVLQSSIDEHLQPLADMVATI